MFICRPIVVVLLCASCSALSAFAQSAPAAPYDEKADDLLQQATARMYAAQKLSGRIVTVNDIPATGKQAACQTRFTQTFRLQKPADVFQEVAAELKQEDGSWWKHTVETATSSFKKGGPFIGPSKSYRQDPLTKNTTPSASQITFSEFFNLSDSEVGQIRKARANGDLVYLRLALDERFNGVLCTVAETQIRQGNTADGAPIYALARIYIGKKDGLIQGFRREVPLQSGEGRKQISKSIVESLILDDKVAIPTL